MIPVQLTIKGLYSYSSSETIDFSPLVSARLFGIFGPVGSGKSAILEAIMFVLFDRSARLNKAGDDRYYNMMNLQSNQMVIDFIFMAGRNHKTKFRFYFMASRNAKDFNKVEVKDRSYYQWSKNDWKPLASPDVLGMSYDNFMQTVIIPQGKFREFIDQKPTARTQMLKELFHLDRFDIAAPAFRLLASAKEKCQFMEGQLSQFTEISEVLMAELVKEVNKIEQQIAHKVNTEQKLSQGIAEMQLLKHLHTELIEVTESLITLKSEKDFYKQKEHQLTRYLRTRDLFGDKIEQQKQLLIEARSKQEQLSVTLSAIQGLEKKVAKYQQEWDKAQAEYQKRDHLENQLDDLNMLKQLQQQRSEFELITDQWVRTKQEIEALDENVQQIQLLIEKSRQQGLEKTNALEKRHKLMRLADWWSQSNEKSKQIESLRKDRLEKEQVLKKLEDEKDHLKALLKNRAVLIKKVEKLSGEVQMLSVQEDWIRHAEHLEEGKPCPLCGAAHHPMPLSDDQLNTRITVARADLHSFEKALEAQEKLEQDLMITETRILEKNQALLNIAEKLKPLQNALDLHLSTYPGSDKPKHQPTKLHKTIRNLEAIIENAHKESSQLEARLAQSGKLESKHRQAQDKLQHLSLKKEKLQGAIDQAIKSLKTINAEAFLKKDQDQLDRSMDRLKQKLKSINQNYQTSFDNLAKCEKKLNHQKGLLQSMDNQVTELRISSEKLEQVLLATCKKESFKSIKEVQNVLALELKVEQERKELENYRAELNTSQSRHETLKRKMGKRRYLESKHLEMLDDFENLKIALNQLHKELSVKQETQQRYSDQLQQKASLTQKLQKLSERKGYLQEISNLLRGNGFINFISSVYLENLCKAANVRFKKLTGNRLSLELNDQNEFMVRDYLNEGKLRLLKTLSGGQIFQASLSLALSLAENVKELNQAEQSFFFLDEGFGALDRSSLHLVFETLKSLQKENRIVGIISHVEDLQLEIDTYLTVNQHQQKGSYISRSWETAD